jgi:hypothetical protein
MRRRRGGIYIVLVYPAHSTHLLLLVAGELLRSAGVNKIATGGRERLLMREHDLLGFLALGFLVGVGTVRALGTARSTQVTAGGQVGVFSSCFCFRGVQVQGPSAIRGRGRGRGPVVAVAVSAC